MAVVVRRRVSVPVCMYILGFDQWWRIVNGVWFCIWSHENVVHPQFHLHILYPQRERYGK